MDVHPPLAKLLITLAGWLAGFNGDFDFKDIGKDYIEPGVPYVAMRLLPAIMGVLTVPIMFLTLKASGCRTSTAALGAAVVTFGIALQPSFQVAPALTLSRKRPYYTVPFHSPRFSSHLLHVSHGIGVHMLHEPTGAGTGESFPRALVVLAGRNGSQLGCDTQR